MTRAAFLGRFQPIHEGHHQVVERYREEFTDFRIIVGSASKERKEKNPLSFEERQEIIQECFPEINVESIEDEGKDEENNRRWAEKLEDRDIDAVISQNDLVKRLVNEYTDLELIEQDLYDPEIYSGTEIRRRIRSGEEWRYLVPGCAKEKIEEFQEIIKESGIQYEFKPGWKKENAMRDTND